ncbi:hypothetical protein Desaci_4729 (plasmid) [Desulfosporosinus acidiphilus SJ4]|uniref:Uncharacterized protein n=1 Tax=Desulfosporosinus acidiphilus (strain DSM 22704 / JCM 16185 / SJ4) TaxID=646529 RepID=I4DCN2_DESAJ|nr:hypothetical protein [Desulfosporosinus acidiphilus]AFM43556.1 hypothetical protein Desaci_4729 [Desulfosporosinus acidiphilus SJ4]
MGNLMVTRYLSIFPYLAILMIALGLFLIVFTRHEFFIVFSDKLRGLPVRLRSQLRAFTQEQIDKNPLLVSDQSALKTDLELSRLRWKGQHLTFYHVVLLSLLCAFISTGIALLITTRYLSIPSQPTSLSNFSGAKVTYIKRLEFNIPAMVQAFFIGFLVPRWLFFMGRVKSRYKYQNEAPKAFFRLSSAIRRHPNLEIATYEATPYMPKYTKWLFTQALDHWKRRDFTSFTEVFYWISKQSSHESWEEFASYAATASSAGLKDMIMKISSLTTRAQELLNKRDDERKGIKFQVILSLVAFGILFFQLYQVIYKNPDVGIYLFITPWGKILLSLVYLAVLVEISIFTWLYYQV